MEVVVMSMADSSLKVVMFVIIQALVYLILSKSSSVFSNNKMEKKLSFKLPRSLSIRRVLASISDLPQGVEPSPSPLSFSRGLKLATLEEQLPQEM